MAKHPFQDLVDTFSAFIKLRTPQVKVAGLGWPDNTFLQVSNNLPGVFYVISSSKPTNHRGRHYDFSQTATNGNNQGTTTHVINRRQYMFQCHILANTKQEVADVHSSLIADIEDQWYLPLQENEQNSLMSILDDHFLTKGEETNFHRSIVTVGLTLRTLSNEVAYGNKTVQIQSQIGGLLTTYTFDEVNDTITYH